MRKKKPLICVSCLKAIALQDHRVIGKGRVLTPRQAGAITNRYPFHETCAQAVVAMPSRPSAAPHIPMKDNSQSWIGAVMR